MRAAIYTRISMDKSGEALGVERQRDRILEVCAARGIDVVAEYEDNDSSAYKLKKPRPQFEEMLKAVADGQIDVIISKHLDRLLRRITELERVLDICEPPGAFIITTDDGVDTSTDGGRLVARILASVAQGEVERKSARQKAALLQRAQAGKSWGSRGFGYTQDCQIVEAEAAAIRDGHNLIQSGATLGAVAALWNAQGLFTARGGKPWSGTTARRVLLNPRNAGIRAFHGDHYPAAWEPIITDETLQKTAMILTNNRGRTPKRYRRGLLTGIAVCGLCQNPISLGTSGQRGCRRTVYACKAEGCRRIQRDQIRVEQLIEDVMVERLSRSDALQLAVRQPVDGDKLRTEADALHERKKALAMNLAKGLMDENDVTEALNYILGRLKVLDNLLYDSQAIELFNPLVNAVDVRKAWKEQPLDRQRAVISHLIEITVNTAPRGKKWHPDCVQIVWKAPH